jgi:hypothetical protein
VFAQEDDNDGTNNDELRAAALIANVTNQSVSVAPVTGDQLVDANFADAAFSGGLQGTQLGALTNGGTDAQGIDAGPAITMQTQTTGATEVFIAYTQVSVANLKLLAAEVDVVNNGGTDANDNIIISSNSNLRDVVGLTTVIANPQPLSPGGNAPAQRIDIVFTQERGDAPFGPGGAGTTSLVHRAYSATAINSTLGFAARFNPTVGAGGVGNMDPFEIDNHTSTNVMFQDTSTAAGALIVTFTQDGHQYSNAFSILGSNSWIIQNGDIEPQIIDNDGGQDSTLELICEACCACDEFGGSVFFFSRLGGSQTPDNNNRLSARAADGTAAGGPGSGAQDNTAP